MNPSTKLTHPDIEPDSHPLLSVENLSTQFSTDRGIVRAVNDVSFVLQRGEILGIVGESGSGKTMTTRSILRIVPDPGKVVAGRVRLEGRDLLSLNESEMSRVRGRQMAMIFQEPSAALNPVLTVGEQISEVLTTHYALSRKEARIQAIQHLREVGIPEPAKRLKAYPHELSGGMQQRCVIAIALACAPQLMIADEPTTALDVTIQAQILDLLVNLTTEKSMGLIFITHDIAAVAQIAQRIVVMYAGKIVETGTTEQIIDDPQHANNNGKQRPTIVRDQRPGARSGQYSLWLRVSSTLPKSYG